MAEKTEQVAEKKRRGKNGYRRVTVTLSEAQYNQLAQLAQAEMREPNNLLSYRLSQKWTNIVSVNQGIAPSGVLKGSAE